MIKDYFFSSSVGRRALAYAGYSWDIRNSGKIGACTIFPYMAPDNNSGLSTYFSRAFFPRSGPIKSKHTEFWDIELKLKEQNLVPHGLFKD